MKGSITNAVFKGKEIKKLPKGAKILKEETRIEVEEIENGFLITKSCEVKYETSSRGVDWSYFNTKTFSTKNPLKIELEEKNFFS